MAVVISEFEVVADPPRPSVAQGQPNASKPGPTPHEIVQSLRRQQERLARVRAH